MTVARTCNITKLVLLLIAMVMVSTSSAFNEDEALLNQFPSYSNYLQDNHDYHQANKRFSDFVGGRKRSLPNNGMTPTEGDDVIEEPDDVTSSFVEAKIDAYNEQLEDSLAHSNQPNSGTGEYKRFSDFIGGKKRFSDFIGGKKRFSDFIGGKKRFSDFIGGKKRFSDFIGGKKRFSDFIGGKKRFSDFIGGKRSVFEDGHESEAQSFNRVIGEKKFSDFLGG